MSQLAHHVHLVGAAAACLVDVHGVTTRKGGHVGLVVGVAEDVQVVQFNHFQVVLEVASVFQRVKKRKKDFESDLAVRAGLVLRALALDSQLIGNLLQTAVERVPVKEAFDVQQVREEEFEHFIELVAVGGQGLVGENSEEVAEVGAAVEADPGEFLVEHEARSD